MTIFMGFDQGAGATGSITEDAAGDGGYNAEL
jgi:hypothetical protein